MVETLRNDGLHQKGLGALAPAFNTMCYQINYWDCTKPGDIQEYNILEYCETQKLLGLQQTTWYHVLQKKRNAKMEGWSCDIIRSTFILHCGMFSHQDFVQMPDIEIRQSVSLQQCQTVINTGYLVTKEETIHDVKVGEETIFHVSEREILHEENNKIWCEGQELKVNINIISGVLKVVQ